MKHTLVLLAAAVLLAAGCTPKGTPSREDRAPAPRIPVAAIVAVREPALRHRHGFATLQRLALWRISLATATPEAIPVRMSENAQPRLSPDGTTLLYMDAPPQQPVLPAPPRTLHRYDLRTGTDSVVTTLTGSSSFGWSRQGASVIVTYSTVVDPGGSFRGEPVATITVQVEGEAPRSLAATAFDGQAVSFLAADGSYVYLSGHAPFMSVNYSSMSVWQLPREGAPVELKELSMGWGAGEQLLPDRTRGAVSYAATPSVLPVGFYVEKRSALTSSGGQEITHALSRVDLYALPGMLDLRSVPMTPPPGLKDDRRPVFDDSFSRYLVTTWRNRVTDLWESDVRGDARMLVSGKGMAQGPVPLGYVGEDFLYRSIEASRVVVRLYERAPGTSRPLGDLGTAERTDPPYDPQTTLLGFAYER